MYRDLDPLDLDQLDYDAISKECEKVNHQNLCNELYGSKPKKAEFPGAFVQFPDRFAPDDEQQNLCNELYGPAPKTLSVIKGPSVVTQNIDWSAPVPAPGINAVSIRGTVNVDEIVEINP